MSVFAELAGTQVLEATVTIPVRGTWTADLTLVEAPASATAGLLTLKLADLELRGTVVRGSTFQGKYRARIIGGHAGWRNTLGPKSYQSDAGLRLGPILKDLAREAGEQVNVEDDRVVGTAFVRRTGPATRTLDELYPDWWVDFDGVTQIAPRPTSTAAAEFTVIDKAPQEGRTIIKTESPASFFPGVSFVAPSIPLTTANMVVHRMRGIELQTTVYSGQDRLLGPLLQLVRRLVPELQYAGVNDYVVVSYDESAQTANLQPLVRTDLPTLQKVQLRTPSMTMKLVRGTKVGVVFRNLDPTQPSIVDYDAPGTGAFAEDAHLKVTDTLSLGPDPQLQVARSGDQTAAGGLGTSVAFSLVMTGENPPIPAPMMTNTPYFITFGNALAVPPVLPTFPAVNPAQGVGQLYGIISTGNPKVIA